ncbi:ribonuclease H-like domain-containing protein [Tanacetum coccineum]
MKFMNKYYPHACKAKKIEEINNFQQESNESLFGAWERFKELLMKCPQHYLTDMQEVILFYNGLDVPTRQILDSKGAIPTKTVADVKIAIKEMAEYSQKWNNRKSSKAKSTKTFDGLAAIQAKLNNLRRDIKKVNEKVYAAQRHEENSNIIKEFRASTDATIRNQGSSIKTLEIQIGQMSKVLQERGIGGLPDSTEPNPRDHVKSISTAKADSSEIRHSYAVSGSLCRIIFSKIVPFPRRLQNYYCDVWREAQDVKILEAYDHTSPQKEKDPRSFTLPCFIHNVCFDKALVDLGASVSVMPFSTYSNLGLGILSHTRLTIELDDRTITQPRGIAENMLVRIVKFIFPIDFTILDIPEDDDVYLILGRPFLSTAHSKIDVYKKKITLRVGEEKHVFKSIKPATSLIRRVFMLKDLDLKTKLIREDNESFDPLYGNYIELNDLDTPLEPETNQDVNFDTTFVKELDNVKTSSEDCYKMKFSCMIGYKNVNADFIPSLSVNLITKSFYYSIIKDKDDHEGKSPAESLTNIPFFLGELSILTGFIIIDDEDIKKRCCTRHAILHEIRVMPNEIRSRG